MSPNQEIDYQHPTKKDQVRFFGFTLFLVLTICAGYFLGLPRYYLGWFSFAIASFSVAGNDAVQTIGTFIESKKSVHWLQKILVFGGLLFFVHLIAWFLHGGEIHFHRLDSIPETKDFNLLQLLAPVLLVVITRLRAPVSTTFLVLGLFGGKSIDQMLTKSFFGYGLAFLVAIVVWAILVKVDPHEYHEVHTPDPVTERRWSQLQWLSTMYLWVAWLFQDTANIAVFLPRQLGIIEFLTAVFILIAALLVIIRTNGGTIQRVVSEKSDIQWAKAATIVDLVYGSLLFFFQYISNVPMSTTWAFLGLLAGREIILNVITYKDLPYLDTFRKVGKDVVLATIGILVSILVFFLSYFLYPEQRANTPLEFWKSPTQEDSL
ncbi:hypothetical protein [Leptospira bandrabouensis]|uniref:Uncharacterized protein n=1 Tax=Leptospira bandrabouensis TaxID=2484903 RepID=A0A6H3NUA6_9LEPT|nr:hypothetical protein [Leptospira bandrabouensis]MCG6143353.1 hypothetical protein [Leptospira bandrabouensis]MCG6159013.1 hypothetical protein [Leptospira bandrabouensis]MCG6162947.1 hypothetical protein [Leptospira bandrabouensis]TGN04624.1 hypothetical protein EHR07_08290 [Leptospira bandrabouensis]TGN14953.1 hypothetical protein EHR08_01205 [Leptospira bandrabouensis]